MDETRRALTLVCVCLQCPVASAYSAISRSAGPEDVGAPMPLGGDGARRRPDIRHGAVSGVGPCPFFVYLMCGQRQRRSRLTARLTITPYTNDEGGRRVVNTRRFFSKAVPYASYMRAESGPRGRGRAVRSQIKVAIDQNVPGSRCPACWAPAVWALGPSAALGPGRRTMDFCIPWISVPPPSSAGQRPLTVTLNT